MSDEVKPEMSDNEDNPDVRMIDGLLYELSDSRTDGTNEIMLGPVSTELLQRLLRAERDRIVADYVTLPCERGHSVPPVALTPSTLLEAILNLHRSTMQAVSTVHLLHSAELAGIVERVVSPECWSADTTAYAATMRIIPEIVWTAHAYDWRVVNGGAS